MRFVFFSSGVSLHSQLAHQSDRMGSHIPTGVICMLITFVLVAILGMAGCGLWVKPHGSVVSLDSQAPGFSLPDQKGQVMRSAQLLRKGPVLIVFYRGHW